MSSIILIAALLASDSATVIHARALLDVRAGKLREKPVIVVRGDRIESVSFGAKQPPRGANVIDLGDAVLLPGLVDAHVHLAWQPSAVDALAQPGISKQAADNARATLDAGGSCRRSIASTSRKPPRVKRSRRRSPRR